MSKFFQWKTLSLSKISLTSIIVIEKICVAKIFWNELQQRWLKSVTCAIQFIFAVKCAMQTN